MLLYHCWELISAEALARQACLSLTWFETHRLVGKPVFSVVFFF